MFGNVSLNASLRILFTAATLMLLLAAGHHAVPGAQASNMLVVSAGGPYTATVGRTVVLTATVPSTATGTYLSFSWQFGDGTSGSGNPASHSYNNAGSYNVAVSVTGSDGTSGSANTAMVVGSQATNTSTSAGLSAGGPYNGTAGQPVSFIANASGGSAIEQYQWDFGDGTSAGFGQNVGHTYSRSGTYPVTLTGGVNGQIVSTATTTAVIGSSSSTSAMSINAGGSYSGVAGRQVSFNATANNAPYDTTFSWVFGDGSGATGQTVTHTYSSSGSYVASVTARSSNTGQTTIDIAQVTIAASGSSSGGSGSTSTGTTGSSPSGLMPMNVSLGGPYQGASGQTIGFSTSGTNVPADAVYAWTFGDGGTASGASASHSYQSAGTFNVTVTVRSNATGQVATDAATVTVAAPATAAVAATATPTQPAAAATQAPPAANASMAVTIAAPTQGVPDGSLSFAANASGYTGSLVYIWSFGDGSAAVRGQQLQHAFSSAGSYTVTVTAMSAGNANVSATATAQVTIASAAAKTTTVAGPAYKYPAGWNLVAAPAGTTFSQASGSLYSFGSGDNNYKQVAPSSGVEAGKGYWAFFNADAVVTFSGNSAASAAVPAAAGQWLMIGNPSATDIATVTGADSVMVYDPTTSTYNTTTTLYPGQAGWAVSTHGGVIAIGPSAPQSSAPAAPAAPVAGQPAG